MTLQASLKTLEVQLTKYIIIISYQSLKCMENKIFYFAEYYSKAVRLSYCRNWYSTDEWYSIYCAALCWTKLNLDMIYHISFGV